MPGKGPAAARHQSGGPIGEPQPQPGAPSQGGAAAPAAQGWPAVRTVLRNVNFRRMWISFALSSIGDWLGILATALVAQEQVTGELAEGAAFGGTIVIRLLPSLLLGPIAGFFADRFDRRYTMIVCDLLRFLLFSSIPIAGTIGWTLGAVFLIEIVGMFWIPAKEAAVPNLVRRDQLEAANQLSLIPTSGATRVTRVSPLFAASGRIVSTAASRTARASSWAGSSSIRPASSLARSSISLTRLSRCRPLS